MLTKIKLELPPKFAHKPFELSSWLFSVESLSFYDLTATEKSATMCTKGIKEFKLK